MQRYEVRFYDAPNAIKVTLELTAVDAPAAQNAAHTYLRFELRQQLDSFALVVGFVRELR